MAVEMLVAVAGGAVIVAVVAVMVIRRQRLRRRPVSSDPLTRARQAGADLSADYMRQRERRRKKGPNLTMGDSGLSDTSVAGYDGY